MFISILVSYQTHHPSYAQNEILCALDFVSLLISKQSVPAQSSMSPALKEVVPIGTLAGRVLKEKSLSAPVRRQLASVSDGWRAAGFQSAAEKLSEASSRLKADAGHESEYWRQIAELTTRGWPVSRLPRDRKAIGVHFGFAESAPQFRDRGFALLRQSDDGSVILDRQAIPRRRKRLAVYILRNNVKTGVYHFNTVRTEQPTSLAQQLTDCRDALFEEELFYEICRETRLVTNQGITTRAQTVEIDVCGEYQISLHFGEDHENETSATPGDNIIAEFVAVSLRLLLSAAHEQNLARRSQKPPTMALKPRAIPEYALVRPVLAHLRHRAEANTFWKSCQALLRPFKQAGLPVTLVIDGSTDAVFSLLKIEPPPTILADMMIPAKTGFKISLTEGRSLQLGLATLLGPPLFGSRYEFSAIDFGFSSFPSSRHETREAAISFLRRILILDLVAHTEGLTRQLKLAREGDKSKLQQWRISHPHSGEITMYEAQEALKKLQLSVQPESVSIKLSALKKTAGSKNVVWSWTPNGCSRVEGNEPAAEAGVTFDEAANRVIKDGI